ncbi:MAG: VWA domain-containing protein [bacterium]
MLLNYIFKFKLIFGLCFLFLIFFNSGLAAGDVDAIAVRVLPNHEHYSAARWYAEQGFSGAPQSIIVDGYEAVRDGRTVYVNAANIVPPNLYTNIYLISYNQEATQQTADIFGQILKHWKFNTNISMDGKCSVSQKGCLSDNDCLESEYCLSEKLYIVRDVKRMADLADMTEMLSRYRGANGKYPDIGAGTYLPNVSMSVWPSWQSILATNFGVSLNNDPVNKLGMCAEGFNPITCWNENNKTYSEGYVPSIDQNSLPQINLPQGSLAYLYSASPNGSVYSLCAEMESGYIQGCSGTGTHTGQTINHSPRLIGANFPTGSPGKEYSGFIEAIDPDGDKLIWSNFAPIGDWGSWQDVVFRDTNNINQKEIHASKAGNVGVYEFTVQINDGRGEILNLSFSITISNAGPKIMINDQFFTADPSQTASYQVVVEDSDLNFTDPIANFDSFRCLSGEHPNCNNGYVYTSLVNTGLGFVSSDCDQNNNRCFYQFEWNPALFIIQDNFSYTFDIAFHDQNNAVSHKTFSITFSNTAPIIEVKKINPLLVGSAIADPGIEVARARSGGRAVITNDINWEHSPILNNGISFTSEIVGNELIVRLVGTPIEKIATYKDYVSTLYVKDALGAVSSKQINFRVFNNPPALNVSGCPSVVRAGQNLSSECKVSAWDPDSGQSINQSTFAFANVFPDGIAISNNPLVKIPGTIHGAPTKAGQYNIAITVEDNLGARGQVNWNLKVDSYCGDNKVQNPNSEGRGGPSGNGQEQCDGADGVAVSPADSGPTRQYWCSNLSIPTLIPECPVGSGNCLGTCSWRGGYCGDGMVQDENNADAGGNVWNFNEKCDIFGTKDGKGGGTSEYDQYKCRNCLWEGGWCGDSSIQTNYGEQCESDGDGASIVDQYQCDSQCHSVSGWCGDGVTQTNYGEECDDGNMNNSDCCGNDCRRSCPGINGDGYESRPLAFSDNSVLLDSNNPADFQNNKSSSHTFYYDPASAGFSMMTVMNFPPCRKVLDSGPEAIEGYLPYKGSFQFEVIPAQETTGIIFVTDVSGSMSGSLQSVKDALKEIITGLYVQTRQWNLDTVYIGLVDFGSSVGWYYSGAPLNASSLEGLLTEIDTYTASGATPTNSAFQYAQAFFGRDETISMSNRAIVMLTDGEPNPLPAEDPVNTVDEIKASGIDIYTIAYGAAVNNSALKIAMCDWSSAGGNNCDNEEYAWVSTASQIEDVLGAITGNVLDVPSGEINIGVGLVESFVTDYFTAQAIPGMQTGEFSVSSKICSDSWQWTVMIVNPDSDGKITVYDPVINYCKNCN